MIPAVFRSGQARIDLFEIWLHIAADNVAAADGLLDAFERTLALISEQPGIGSARDELAPGLRSFPVGNYILFYCSASDGIELVRVLHGARDLRRLFRRDV